MFRPAFVDLAQEFVRRHDVQHRGCVRRPSFAHLSAGFACESRVPKGDPMSISTVAARTAPSSSAKRQVSWRRYRDLVAVNAIRFLKVRYRGSILGIYWSLSNPLLMTGVYTLIFGTTFAGYYGGSVVNYVLACFTGLAFLNFFSSASSMALPTIVSNGGLLNKLALPASVFPVATVTAAAFQLCVGVLPLLAIVAAVTSHSPINVIALAVPVAALLMLSMGFALAAAALDVYFRDLPYLYELVVFVLWITSPIFYPIAVVPAAVRDYIAYNPLTVVVECARQIALSGTHPSLHLMGWALLTGAAALAAGIGVYAALRRGFMDLV
jgi:ABC-type polysaccharide/polyol phosphate export permease